MPEGACVYRYGHVSLSSRSDAVKKRRASLSRLSGQLGEEQLNANRVTDLSNVDRKLRSNEVQRIVDGDQEGQ